MASSSDISLELIQRGIKRVPTYTRVSAGGNTPKGIRSVTFYNAGAANATVLTTNLLPQEKLTIDAGGQGDHLDEISYDGSGTDLVIVTIT
jgi:hypothetical protein